MQKSDSLTRCRIPRHSRDIARLARREKASIWTVLLSGATPEASFMTECISELPLGPAAAPEPPTPHSELQAGMRRGDGDNSAAGHQKTSFSVVTSCDVNYVCWAVMSWPPSYQSNCFISVYYCVFQTIKHIILEAALTIFTIISVIWKSRVNLRCTTARRAKTTACESLHLNSWMSFFFFLQFVQKRPLVGEKNSQKAPMFHSVVYHVEHMHQERQLSIQILVSIVSKYNIQCTDTSSRKKKKPL